MLLLLPSVQLCQYFYVFDTVLLLLKLLKTIVQSKLLVVNPLLLKHQGLEIIKEIALFVILTLQAGRTVGLGWHQI